ncbi:hypothetical protein L228DRAFT_96827 [Xylona heveae TC161]|uniref:Uncharacterized protein n=1 Tax=Xylona heveae (strain CBS 132557 / TC161) TaxID=1328760 RepID=A0A165I6B2_XYLHT|nr:hypothetical protein L228DRAFT_96827 [Xylona heveae TC161]KZF24449.1 hypothetical protein L228DRAFT_96827 [Xylona heveae TC161]
MCRYAQLLHTCGHVSNPYLHSFCQHLRDELERINDPRERELWELPFETGSGTDTISGTDRGRGPVFGSLDIDIVSDLDAGIGMARGPDGAVSDFLKDVSFRQGQGQGQAGQMGQTGQAVQGQTGHMGQKGQDGQAGQQADYITVCIKGKSKLGAFSVPRRDCALYHRRRLMDGGLAPASASALGSPSVARQPVEQYVDPAALVLSGAETGHMSVGSRRLVNGYVGQAEQRESGSGTRTGIVTPSEGGNGNGNGNESADNNNEGQETQQVQAQQAQQTQALQSNSTQIETQKKQPYLQDDEIQDLINLIDSSGQDRVLSHDQTTPAAEKFCWSSTVPWSASFYSSSLPLPTPSAVVTMPTPAVSSPVSALLSSSSTSGSLASTPATVLATTPTEATATGLNVKSAAGAAATENNSSSKCLPTPSQIALIRCDRTCSECEQLSQWKRKGMRST